MKEKIILNGSSVTLFMWIEGIDCYDFVCPLWENDAVVLQQLREAGTRLLFYWRDGELVSILALGGEVTRIMKFRSFWLKNFYTLSFWPKYFDTLSFWPKDFDKNILIL